ncbi:MAG: hypothetical protein JXR48_18105 [Candidatus Delongbacteria bacterium]|nr:hypothetical protein [Candidatus Delongbacteria bacterium]
MEKDTIIISIDRYHEMLAKEQELAEYKIREKDDEKKKENRALSQKKNSKKTKEEKEFLKILRAANRSLKFQHYKDSGTYGGMLKKRISKDNFELDFFTIFNERLKVILGVSAFEKCCADNGLKKEPVAQFIVTQGERALNNVFKYGLEQAYKVEQLKLIEDVVFTPDDLKLEQYKANKHPEKLGNSEN